MISHHSPCGQLQTDPLPSFRWSGAKVKLDSAVVESAAKTSFDYFQFVYRSNNLDSSNFYREAVFGGVRKASSGLAPSEDFVPIAKYFFTAFGWNRTYELLIDSSRVGPMNSQGVSGYIAPDLRKRVAYHPIWSGPLVIHDPDRPCCVNIMGNIDGADGIDIGDQTLLIDHLFGSGVALSCRDAANIDGSEDGSIDMGDLVVLTEYLFAGGELAECR